MQQKWNAKIYCKSVWCHFSSQGPFRYGRHTRFWLLQSHVPKGAPGFLYKSPLSYNFIKWNWVWCSVHILRGPGSNRLIQNGESNVKNWHFLLNLDGLLFWMKNFFVFLFNASQFQSHKDQCRLFVFQSVLQGYQPAKSSCVLNHLLDTLQ